MLYHMATYAAPAPLGKAYDKTRNEHEADNTMECLVLVLRKTKNKSPTKAEARHDEDAKWKIVEVFMCLV
jgi:hypothetical protein